MPRSLAAALPDARVRLRAAVGPIRDSAGGMTGLLFVADEETASDTDSSEPLSGTDGRVRLALRRYLGENIATMVERRPSFIGVGGVRRQVSVLHADMRGYASAAERMQPEDLIDLLLRYHGEAVSGPRFPVEERQFAEGIARAKDAEDHLLALVRRQGNLHGAREHDIQAVP